MPETVMIVAGETSGELYGSLLADALRKKFPGVKITGVGGERMRASGVELIAGISSAFGLAEAVSSIRALRETFTGVVAALKRDKPAVAVLIDYPDFNLRLAGEARKLGVRILYYVSPQVWAWRRGRVRKIAGLTDRMAVVLPFEPELYRDTGLECEFVGHPVFDEIRGMNADKGLLRRELGLSAERPLLSLLPGSRPHEIERLLPVIVEVIATFRKEFPDYQFCVPFAPNTDIGKYGALVEELKKEGVLINRGESLRTLAASDLGVVASGTASLQAVLLGLPIVVVYKLFPLTYWMGKMIVKVDYVSLVNILSGREVVRELLQSAARPGTIMAELRKMLGHEEYRAGMIRGYESVRKMFSEKNASERVAEMVMEMAGWK